MRNAEEARKATLAAQKRAEEEWRAGEPARREAARLKAEEEARQAELQRLAAIEKIRLLRLAADAQARDFIENTCRPSIDEAVSASRFRVVIEIEERHTDEYKHFTQAVVSRLTAEGFDARYDERAIHISPHYFESGYNIPPRFSISWEVASSRKSSRDRGVPEPPNMVLSWILGGMAAVLALGWLLHGQ